MSNITGRLLNAFRMPLADGTYRLGGDIYEDVHERFNDGAFVITSVVVLEEGNVVSTKFSIYEVESWATWERV